MLKGVNNQSNAYSNKRRSGMRSRATRDAAMERRRTYKDWSGIAESSTARRIAVATIKS